MWFVVVVPAPPRAIRFLNPALLRGVLDVSVAEENIGPAAVTLTR